VAISLFSIGFEIASVVSLPRDDITTHSPRGWVEEEVILILEFKFIWDLEFVIWNLW
jgi:hypothetical protein